MTVLIAPALAPCQDCGWNTTHKCGSCLLPLCYGCERDDSCTDRAWPTCRSCHDLRCHDRARCPMATPAVPYAETVTR